MVKYADGKWNWNRCVLHADFYAKVCLMRQSTVVKTRRTDVIKRDVAPKFNESFSFKMMTMMMMLMMMMVVVTTRLMKVTIFLVQDDHWRPGHVERRRFGVAKS